MLNKMDRIKLLILLIQNMKRYLKMNCSISWYKLSMQNNVQKVCFSKNMKDWISYFWIRQMFMFSLNNNSKIKRIKTKTMRPKSNQSQMKRKIPQKLLIKILIILKSKNQNNEKEPNLSVFWEKIKIKRIQSLNLKN